MPENLDFSNLETTAQILFNAVSSVTNWKDSNGAPIPKWDELSPQTQTFWAIAANNFLILPRRE